MGQTRGAIALIEAGLTDLKEIDDHWANRGKVLRSEKYFYDLRGEV